MIRQETLTNGTIDKNHHLSKKPYDLYPGGGGGVLPYMGYIGMCGPKGYGFSAILVINRV